MKALLALMLLTGDGGFTMKTGERITLGGADIAHFYNGDNWVVKLHQDGNVTVNPKFTLDEASKRFWDLVRKEGVLRCEREQKDGGQ